VHVYRLGPHFHVQQDLVELLLNLVGTLLPGVVEQQAGDGLAEHGDGGGLDLRAGEIINFKLGGGVPDAAALRKQDGRHGQEHGPDEEQFPPAERIQPGMQFVFHHAFFPCQNRTVSRPFALR